MRNLQLAFMVVSLGFSMAGHAETKRYQMLKNSTINHDIAQQGEEGVAWGLTQEEYQEYQKLMQNTPAKMRYQQLEPAEVLGIMAKTDTQRKYFATIMAKSQHERIKRELALQVAYEQAFNELFPNIKVIKDEGMERFSGDKLTKVEKGDRLILFADTGAESSSIVLTKLLNLLSQDMKVGLDVYLVGGESKASINEWAKQHRVPVEWVSQGLVTLNFDKGLFKSLFNGISSELPVVALNRNGKLKLVALNSI